jgi:hypothetical protein
MQQHRNLRIPDTLADVCDPDRMAVVVYDMQVGVVSQLADSAAKRSLDTLATAGDAILTDISTITELLAGATTSDPRRRGSERTAQEDSR